MNASDSRQCDQGCVGKIRRQILVLLERCADLWQLKSAEFMEYDAITLQPRQKCNLASGVKEETGFGDDRPD
ncbi:hypothetical protein CCR82_09625 [Halochromatium salexigens]|uniref:Uncharacterized protein n=1 Tax=Halochromatium salexigens TaxID=49447 RepID=A0AAJ0UHT1_HALSE|nr:hypothetical protein [Halochromatium salexigens]